MRQKLKRWTPVISVFAITIVLSFIWYFTFIWYLPSAWEKTPNYAQMYIEFVVTRPADAFLTVSTGPGGGTGFIFIPAYSLIIIHIILYVIGKQKKIQYTFLNKYYLIYLVLLGLFAISFQNASQHYNWYWDPELNAPGYVDTWTHITSPWLLGALIAPLALERFLGWERKFMWLFIFAVIAITALCWEISETLDVYMQGQDPTYFNYPMDSLKDMIMGAVGGTLLSCFIYERLVTDLGEKA